MNTTKPALRPRQRQASPSQSGQPDPRPVTDYSVAVTTALGNTIITITLDQPCVVRSPHWAFIDCADGTRVFAPAMVVVDNRTFAFQFSGLLAPSVAFVDVPYQDTQVQNSQGGFVRPGRQVVPQAGLRNSATAPHVHMRQVRPPALECNMCACEHVNMCRCVHVRRSAVSM